MASTVDMKIERRVSLTGSVTAEGKNVLYLNSQLSKDGSDQISQTVQDKELYQKYSKEIRQKIREFNEASWAAQDEIAKEAGK